MHKLTFWLMTLTCGFVGIGNALEVGLSTNLWGPDVRLTQIGLTNEQPVIVALQGGALGLSYTTVLQSEVDAEVRFASGPQLGILSPTVLVATNGSDKLNTAVAIDAQGRIHLIYPDSQPGNFELFYRASDDQGTNWSKPIRLTDAPNESWNAQLKVFGEIIYVVWDDNRSGLSGWTFVPTVYVRSSTNRGASWLPEVRVSDTTTSYAWWPRMLLDQQGTLHVIWTDQRDGHNETYYDYSTDGGASWHNDAAITRLDQVVSDYAAWTLGPSNTIHLVWLERISDTQVSVYHRQSLGNISLGVTNWSQPVLVSSYRPTNIAARLMGPRPQSYEVNCGVPVCGFVKGTLHVAWSDYLVVETPGGQVQNSSIYWTYSMDSGQSWSNTARISEHECVIKHLNSLATDSRFILVWSDSREVGLEIYGKAFTLTPDDQCCIVTWGLDQGRFRLSWTAQPQRIYQVEKSVNLTDWVKADNGSTMPLESSLQTDASSPTLEYRDPTPLTTQAYYRIHRIDPDP